MKINIPIMFCFDTNYVIPASVAFYSLLDNANKNYNYTFYVLHSDITSDQMVKLQDTISKFDFCKIEFINMNNKLNDFWRENYGGGHFSKEVMYKLLCASIFPNIDKIIVSDVDVVFLNDISDSFFQLTDNDDAYIAGVKPIGKVSNYLQNYKPLWSEEEIEKLGNVCGGYLVMNLKRIRQDNMEKVFLESLDENGYRLNQMEQDIFNITCYGKIKRLNLEYVACTYMWDYYKTQDDLNTDKNYTEEEIQSAMNAPIQLHYATSIKPWKNVDCTKSEEWYKYIVKTTFLKEFLKELPEKIVIPNVPHNKKKQRKNICKLILNNKKISKIKHILKIIVKNPLIIFNLNYYKKYFDRIRYKNKSLLIIDDIFPSNISPFRYEEFLAYFSYFPNVYSISSRKTIKLFNNRINLNLSVKQFEESYPNYKNRFIDKKDEKKISSMKKPLAYLVFKNNLTNNDFENLKFLESHNIPFIFTLYPGGGMLLNNSEVNLQLKKIFCSKNFRKVIITQKNVKDYLISKGFCSEKQIEYIYGVVASNPVNSPLRIMKKSSEEINIIFAAHKYSSKGLDKGYDLFIESAIEILKKSINNIKFHVVGGFDSNDISIKNYEKHFVFHGIMENRDFNQLLNEMDIMISPVRTGILEKGAFDGFPTTTSIDAMLRGVALITTDELNNNYCFENHKDIVIIKPNKNEIIKAVLHLTNDLKDLLIISQNGQKKATELFSYNKQINRRINVIKSAFKKK